MEKTNNTDVVQQCKALAGQNRNTEGQEALIAAYQEATRDQELPETPPSVWCCWLELGRQAEKQMSYLKDLWLWKH